MTDHLPPYLGSDKLKLVDAACYWCGICVGGRCDDCRSGKIERIEAILNDSRTRENVATAIDERLMTTRDTLSMALYDPHYYATDRLINAGVFRVIGPADPALRERVAAAMFVHDYNEPWETATEPERTDYLRLARAAIEAVLR